MGSSYSGDIIFLAFLAFVLFGPRKLPEILKTVGRFVGELKRASNEFQGEFKREVGDGEPSQPAKALGSLTDRIRAASAADSPVKALVALAERAPPEPPLGGTSLIDNVNRIKDFLASCRSE
jgi:sec-independent protein translocase protein TatB